MYRRIITLLFLVLVITSCNQIEEESDIETEIKEPLDFSPDNVIANGDVVNLHGEYSNIDVLNNFIENVSLGNEDNIRIVQYTTEGDPIIAELRFNGKTIYFLEDHTMDNFGSGEVIIDTYKSIEIREINRNDKLSKRVVIFDDEHEYDLMAYPME